MLLSQPFGMLSSANGALQFNSARLFFFNLATMRAMNCSEAKMRERHP
jgi:hypothetical protein